jgi:hypothetical protein
MGRCPECGTPVGVSVSGDFLRFSDPAWLRTIAQGMSLILWGILVGVVVGIAGQIIFRGVPVLHSVIALLASSIGVTGAWMMTTPDPGSLGQEKAMNARTFTRIAVACGVGSSALQLIQVSLAHGGASLPVLAILYVPFAIIGVVGEFTKFAYIGRLAMRIPNAELAKKAEKVRWGYAISLGVVVICGAIVVMMAALGAGGGTGRAGGFMFVGCSAGIAGIVLLVYAIKGIVLISNMRKAIAEQSHIASQIWSEHAASMRSVPENMG